MYTSAVLSQLPVSSLTSDCTKDHQSLEVLVDAQISCFIEIHRQIDELQLDLERVKGARLIVEGLVATLEKLNQ